MPLQAHSRPRRIASVDYDRQSAHPDMSAPTGTWVPPRWGATAISTQPCKKHDDLPLARLEAGGTWGRAPRGARWRTLLGCTLLLLALLWLVPRAWQPPPLEGPAASLYTISPLPGASFGAVVTGVDLRRESRPEVARRLQEDLHRCMPHGPRGLAPA